MMYFYEGTKGNRDVLGVFSNDRETVKVYINHPDNSFEFNDTDSYFSFERSFKDKILIIVEDDNFYGDVTTVEGSAWDKVVKKYKERWEQNEAIATS